MIWKRGLIPAHVGFMVLCGVIGGLLIGHEYPSLARYWVCGLLLTGSICATVGYLRYIPSGPTLMALLALLIDKSAMFAIMAIGFFIIALAGGGSTLPTLPLMIAYGLFSAASGAVLFAGLFVLFGANRGWIAMDVYKFFWWRR